VRIVLKDITPRVIIHELAHAWDFAWAARISTEFFNYTGGVYEDNQYIPGDMDSGGKGHAPSEYATWLVAYQHLEDFADPVAANIEVKTGVDLGFRQYNPAYGGLRYDYVQIQFGIYQNRAQSSWYVGP
jgi:hypothetical protein